MTSARESAHAPHCLSLGAQVSEASPSAGADGRKDPSSVKLFTAFAVLAASPATVAQAQQAAEPADDLPPLVVETTAKKKKQAAAKKKVAPTSPVPQAAPAPEPVAERPTTPPLPGQAGPVAPGQYNAEYVTSPKVTGPLLNTPQTVTVVPGTIIQERKTTSLIQTLKQTPGITIDAGENGFASGGLQFGIRGFNSISNVFVDGTRDNGAFPRDTFNVAQIEVFKGPAADNGRGGAGGYVNIVTKTPGLEDFVEAQVGIGFDEYDSEMRRRASTDVNQSSGSTAVRLNAFVEDGGVAGRDIAEANAYGVAPSVAFGLGTETRAIFSYEHVERYDVPDSGVAINRHPSTHATRIYGVGVKGAGPRDYIKNLPRDTAFGRSSDFDDVTADAFMARFEHDLSDSVTVTNQTRWAKVDRQAEYRIPGQGTDLPVPTPNYYDRENETFTNQTNLAASFTTGPFRHTLSTGVEYSREQSDGFRFSATDPSRTNVEVNSIAGYLYDTIDLSRHWQVVGGLRVEHYDADISARFDDGTPGNFDGVEVTDTTVGGKVGIVYKPVREGSLYASYGTSVLPPGAYLSNPDVSRPGSPGDDEASFPGFIPDADPVRMHNYEVGVKWDWLGGKLSTTAALFHTVKENVAYGGGANPIVYGEQEVQGIELGIAGNLTDRWKVFGGLTLLDSERKHGQDVDDALCCGNGDYSGQGGADTHPDWRNVATTNGDELSFTPKVFATLWTTYDVTNALTVGGGFQYVGESWIGRPDDATRVIPNGKFGKLPDYFLVNLYASYDVTENIELSLNVDNVFDELYLTTTNWNGRWGYLGPPRTYWLNANVKF